MAAAGRDSTLPKGRLARGDLGDGGGGRGLILSPRGQPARWRLEESGGARPALRPHEGRRAYPSIVDTYGPSCDVAAARARISVLDADSRLQEMRRAEERTDARERERYRRDWPDALAAVGTRTGLDCRTAEHGGVAVDLIRKSHGD